MARYDRSVTGKVVSTRHAGTSVNGNPAYDVTLDNGVTYRTSSDSGLAYEIQNPVFRVELHEYDLTRPTRNSPNGRLSGHRRVIATDPTAGEDLDPMPKDYPSILKAWDDWITPDPTAEDV